MGIKRKQRDAENERQRKIKANASKIDKLADKLYRHVKCKAECLYNLDMRRITRAEYDEEAQDEGWDEAIEKIYIKMIELGVSRARLDEVQEAEYIKLKKMWDQEA